MVVLLYDINTYFLAWIVSLNSRKTAISDSFYFLQMFVKLATVTWLIVVFTWWRVMFVLKHLVRQVDGYKGLNVCIVVDLRVVLVTVDHHALFCVLDQVSIITTFFTKLLSADADQASADWPVSPIFDLYPISALTVYALYFQCCLTYQCVSHKYVLIENRKLNEMIPRTGPEAEWSHLKLNVSAFLGIRLSNLLLKRDLGVDAHLGQKRTQVYFELCLQHRNSEKTT